MHGITYDAMYTLG